ncbi:MAG TPA: CPBP family intramembrane glutamic endopeptidase [Myxococcota bacterium]
MSSDALARATPAEDGRADRPWLVLAIGAVVTVYSHFYDAWRLPPRLPFGTVGLVLGGDALPLLVVPLLAARFVLREPLPRTGFRWPGVRRVLVAGGLAWLALLPLVAWLATRPEFQAYYPSPAFPPARAHAVGLAFLWLLHHAPQMLATEYCYRGFLLMPIARSFGLPRALVILGALYVALHADKPPLELGLAAAGSVAFSLAAWRTGSFWPAFLAHWAVAVTMDALCFAALHR